jgi:hypothetical protein
MSCGAISVVTSRAVLRFKERYGMRPSVYVARPENTRAIARPGNLGETA